MPIRGDRKSERRQGACWIQALFQLSQLGQPGAERRLQLLVMEGQMVMKLRQMHTRADRLKDLPDLLQPSKTASLARASPGVQAAVIQGFHSAVRCTNELASAATCCVAAPSC